MTKYLWLALGFLAPGAISVWLIGGAVTMVSGVFAMVGGAWVAFRWRRMNPKPQFGLWRASVLGFGASFVLCGSIAISMGQPNPESERRRIGVAEAERQAAEAEQRQMVAPRAASPSGEAGKVGTNLNTDDGARHGAMRNVVQARKQWPLQMSWADAETFLRQKGYPMVAPAEEEPTTLRGNDRRCTTKEDCDSVRPEIDFDYSKQGNDGPPKCITVFHVKPINWRAIISEFTGGAGSTVPKARGKSPRARTIKGASGPVDIVTYPDETMGSRPV